MPRKSRVSDEQFITLIEQGLDNTSIAKRLGMSYGGIYARVTQLRKRHFPLPTETAGKAEVPVAKPLLKYSEVNIEDRLTRNGKRYVVVRKSADNMVLRDMEGHSAGVPAEKFDSYGFKKVQSEFSNYSPVVVTKIQPASEEGPQKETDVAKPESGSEVTWASVLPQIAQRIKDDAERANEIREIMCVGGENAPAITILLAEAETKADVETPIKRSADDAPSEEVEKVEEDVEEEAEAESEATINGFGSVRDNLRDIMRDIYTGYRKQREHLISCLQNETTIPPETVDSYNRIIEIVGSAHRMYCLTKESEKDNGK